MLGHPIAHSLSPVLHRAAYAALGLDWSYDAIECREDQLASVLAERPDYRHLVFAYDETEVLDTDEDTVDSTSRPWPPDEVPA